MRSASDTCVDWMPTRAPEWLPRAVAPHNVPLKKSAPDVKAGASDFGPSRHRAAIRNLVAIGA
jgi:hypothetical protein